jgi:glutathione S-transferase
LHAADVGLGFTAQETAMLTLFHAPDSRSTRFIWLLEELGAPYDIEYVDIRRRDGSGAADPRNPHPSKQVPAIVHDGVLVTESAAIACYLTDAFPEAGIGPVVGDPLRGPYLTWLAHYAGVVEPVVTSKFEGATESDPAKAAAYDQMVERFRGALAKGPYLLGDRFSAADILFASLLGFARQILPPDQAFDDLLSRTTARPAFARAQAKNRPAQG